MWRTARLQGGRRKIGEKIGNVSILVNNAGINRRNSFTWTRRPS